MPRTAVLAPLVAIPLTLAALALGPAAAAGGSTGAGVRPSPSSTVDRVVTDPRIAEASGLTTSLRHRGVLWTHNDSGNSAVLFAVRADGRTAAAVRVSGAQAYDWEAIASYRDAAGRPMLAVADIGDNRAERRTVRIVTLPEPALKDGTVKPSRVLRLTYPGGAVDAEAMLVDPDGRRAFIVTKGFGSTIYEVPPAAWTSPTATEATLVKVASTPLLFATDGVMGPGGHPLLRTYSELVVLPPLTDGVRGGSLRPLAEMRLPAQRQGESIALLDASTAVAGSEGEDAPIVRVPLPADFRAVLSPPTPSPSPGRSGGPGRPSSGRAAPGGAPDGGPGLPLTRPVVLGGAVLVAGAAVVFLLGRSRGGTAGRTAGRKTAGKAGGRGAGRR